MSMTRYTAKCDWPKCKAILEVDQIYLGVMKDHRWESDTESGMHLCKEHGHKTWDELDIAMFEDEWEASANNRL